MFIKNTTERMERQERLQCIYLTKDIYPTYIKNSKYVNEQKGRQPIRKGQNILIKMDIQKVNKYVERYSIILVIK